MLLPNVLPIGDESMRFGLRVSLLLLILACCGAGYFYSKNQNGGGFAAANNNPHTDRVPTTEEEKLARRLVEDKDFSAMDQALDQSRKDDSRTSDGLSRLSVLYVAIAEEL